MSDGMGEMGFDAGENGGRQGRGRTSGRGSGRGSEGVRASLSAQAMFDRQPPHSSEAEMSLLGSMLLDHRVIGDVIHIVRTREQFFHTKHGAIYQALVRVYDEQQSGDLVQIAQHLRDEGVLDEVGGPDYLVELVEGVPTAVNAPHYARIVAEKARLRRLIDAAGQILHEAYHAPAGSDEARGIIDRAETAVFDVAGQDETRTSAKLADLLTAELERIEAAEGKGFSGLRTGFGKLDKMTSGLQPDELIIIAARPSMGKTALALNLAEQIAFGGRTPFEGGAGEDDAVPVGVFSLEMSREALTQRLLSARSGINQQLLRSGDLTDGQWGTLNRAAGELYEAPIIIDDTPGLTLLGLRAKARRMHSKYGVKCVVIDYLQLLTAPGFGRESRQVEVSAISRGIKALARELSIPVICLAQLNRGAEERRRPRMSDLRESGSIEQDADVVALLHREDYYHQGDEQWLAENPDQVGLAELILDKQRNGPTGVVKLTWDREITRFKNHADEHDDNDYGYADVSPGGGYASPSSAAAHMPDVVVPPVDRPADRPVQRATFAPGSKSGPVANHRDGGGPDAEFEGSEPAPF